MIVVAVRETHRKISMHFEMNNKTEHEGRVFALYRQCHPIVLRLSYKFNHNVA